MSLEDDIKKLQVNYTKSADKDTAYAELLEEYKKAQEKIKKLEAELEKKANQMPSKDEVETMSSMLDLISKLDEPTIEKLNRFGTNK